MQSMLFFTLQFARRNLTASDIVYPRKSFICNMAGVYKDEPFQEELIK